MRQGVIKGILGSEKARAPHQGGGGGWGVGSGKLFSPGPQLSDWGWGGGGGLLDSPGSLRSGLRFELVSKNVFCGHLSGHGKAPGIGCVCARR